MTDRDYVTTADHPQHGRTFPMGASTRQYLGQRKGAQDSQGNRVRRCQHRPRPSRHLLQVNCAGVETVG